MSQITIFSDGSSKGNPGPGGWAAIVADEAHVREVGGREEHTTNNRMELRAAIEALAVAREIDPHASVILRTDSAYVVKGATQWIHGWKKRGWITSQQKEVLSQDLWKPLAAFIEDFDGSIRWENIGGHVGIPGNERVDAIAQTFAEGGAPGLYAGDRMNYDVDLDSVDHNVQLRTTRDRKKLPAYSYVSEVGGKVQKHRTWEECKRAVSGQKARYRKTISAEDEARAIAEFSL